MKNFKFSIYGHELATRLLGKKVREILLPLIKGTNSEKIVLDFEGVNIVTNSFADECLAKIIYDIPFETLKSRTTFRNLNDTSRRYIAFAFQRRLNEIKSPA
ncbi:MAG: STAS-like domain-containing protein [Bacteroidales bacterium]|nr:STAS-like domain-containing protein [Bacteroidales bacterium]